MTAIAKDMKARPRPPSSRPNAAGRRGQGGCADAGHGQADGRPDAEAFRRAGEIRLLMRRAAELGRVPRSR